MPLRLIRVVDTETTGLPENGPVDLVEIGWTDLREGFVDGGLAIERGPLSAVVKPTIPISFGAMATHHITEEMASAGISQDEARAIVAGADIFVAHNAAFDAPLISNDARVLWICTLKCARHLWPEMESHGNGALRYALGLCLDPDDAEKTQPAHRAGPDTWVTAHILLELSKSLSLDQMIEISRRPSILLKVPFGEHYGKPFSEVPGGYLDWILRAMANDPKREDVVFTARNELQRRARAEFSSIPAETEDPDAWRSQVGRS